MIDWENVTYNVPPILEEIPDEQLTLIGSTSLQLPAFPCHSQGVERMVKEVTRVSSKVFEHSSRHGMIVSAQISRRQYKKLECKKDFMS